MNPKERQRQEEEAWLEHCLRIIRSNIARYGREYEARHAQVQELFPPSRAGTKNCIPR